MGFVLRVMLFKGRTIGFWIFGSRRKVWVLSCVKPGLRCKRAYRSRI